MKKLLYFAFAFLLMQACTTPESDDSPAPAKDTVQQAEKIPTWQGTAMTGAYQSDGKLVLLGRVAKPKLSSKFTSHIYRMESVDSLDRSFDTTNISKVFNTEISYGRILVQADDKIVFSGVPQGETGYKLRLARLNADGTVDAGFTDRVKNIIGVRDFNQSADGSLYVLTDQDYQFIKLTKDGAPDPSFKLSGFSTEFWSPYHIKLHKDKVFFINDNIVIKLNANGSVDNSFTFKYLVERYNSTEYSGVDKVSVQADGKVLIMGRFDKILDGDKAYTYNGIARLHPDGSIDTSFKDIGGTKGIASSPYILPDDTFIRSHTVTFSDNDQSENIQYFDKDGNLLSETQINGLISDLVRADGKKLTFVGGFFDPYDFLEIGLDPYAADKKPVLEVTLK